jgi:hypothetical protein
MVNNSGSVDDGAVVPNGCVAGVTRGAVASTAADMGKVAAIRLGNGFVGEPALFEQWIQQQRLAIGARGKRRTRRQHGDGFENFHHGLRRFEAARVEFDQLRFHLRLHYFFKVKLVLAETGDSGLEKVSSMENCVIALTEWGRFGGI